MTYVMLKRAALQTQLKLKNNNMAAPYGAADFLFQMFLDSYDTTLNIDHIFITLCL